MHLTQISSKKLLWLFLTTVPMAMIAQNTISVEVSNIPSAEGKVNIAVYNSETTFLKFEGVVKARSVEAKKGKVNLKLENIPEGEYALAIFHDENGNDKLDKNWLGIPTEKVAFSRAKMKTFGPPSYRDCCFKVTGDKAISITF
ncbi:MAG: DUF2141 domain-containing protein [Allomuricauda sp.]